MTIKKRWMQGITDQAAKHDTPLPWARGAIRTQTIARRKALQAAQQKAA